MRPTLLPEVLRSRAAATPMKPAYVFLTEDGDPKTTLTYAELHARALSVAGLLSRRCRPGDRALLVFGQTAEFIVAYFGCLYAQVIAVPVNPPRRNRVHEATRSIVADCEPAAVLTVQALLNTVRPALEPLCSAGYWLAVDDPGAASTGFEPRPPSAESVAFLQYTSGSTSTPKGVMVSHGNLVANEEMIRNAFGHDENSTVVGWAPFFHDQGLIGNVLQPLYVGATCYLMSPMAFLRQPLSWLTAISRYRVHTSGGPNFAFDACVARAARGAIPDLDLSCWKVAFNGAEPIQAATLREFCRVFGPYGFSPGALYPCYGLAEATLIVTGSRKGRGLRTVTADIDALGKRRYAPSRDGRTLVGSGTSLPGEEIRIVDPDQKRRCTASEVGEIWVSGEHVAQGYWKRAEDDAFSSDGDRTYLRTGDLGVLVDDELYVVGRIKDLIIIRGRNYYPQDIEQTAQSAHPALRPGCCAAFPVPAPAGERLVVIQEIRRDCLETADAQDIVGTMRAAIAGEHDVTAAIVLTTPGQLPKTTSGKIMRAVARKRYLSSELTIWGNHAG